MCLAIQLEIKTDKCYYIPRNSDIKCRDPHNYDHLYDTKYIFNNTLKKQKFTAL